MSPLAGPTDGGVPAMKKPGLYPRRVDMSGNVAVKRLTKGMAGSVG
jgi:hypothetical protein